MQSNIAFDQSEFLRDGIVWPLVGTDESSATSLLDRYNKFQSNAVKHRGREIHLKPHLVSTWLDNIVCHPNILDAVEAAIGPNILLWSSDFAVKGAGAGTWIPWHQDTPYWNLSSTRVVSVWYAITDAVIDNGAMKVITGTHRSGAKGRINYDGDPHKGIEQGNRPSSDGNLFFYDHIMDETVDESKAVDVELNPGQFSMHHINLVHGGGPNESSRDRIGFVMRYMSADTYCSSGMDSSLLVRGEYNGDQIHLENRPTGDFNPEDLAGMEHALSFPSGFGDRDMSKGK
jgi:non-heme Fe2+,alpha-ketoglutarate-dependent halogenase